MENIKTTTYSCTLNFLLSTSGCSALYYYRTDGREQDRIEMSQLQNILGPDKRQSLIV
jgi:hypothetical protein